VAGDTLYVGQVGDNDVHDRRGEKKGCKIKYFVREEVQQTRKEDSGRTREGSCFGESGSKERIRKRGY